MILRLLAIKRISNVPVLLGVKRVEPEGGDSSEGDALVRRPKDDIEGVGEVRVRGDGGGVGVGEDGELAGGREVAGLEEVRGGAAGFEREGAEGEDAVGDAGVKEGALVRGEGGGGGGHCGWWRGGEKFRGGLVG